MQISIYLDDKLIKKIDSLTKKEKKSRSGTIQAILEKELTGKKKKSVFEEVFGILKPGQGEELLSVIRSSRLNSDRFR